MQERAIRISSINREKIGKGRPDNFIINFNIFVLSSYKVVIEISNNYQLDLRETEFGDLIGFDKNYNKNRAWMKIT